MCCVCFYKIIFQIRNVIVVCLLNLLFDLLLLAIILVFCVGSCVVFFKRSMSPPGGNQVDGLPPALSIFQVRFRFFLFVFG